MTGAVPAPEAYRLGVGSIAFAVLWLAYLVGGIASALAFGGFSPASFTVRLFFSVAGVAVLFLLVARPLTAIADGRVEDAASKLAATGITVYFLSTVVSSGLAIVSPYPRYVLWLVVLFDMVALASLALGYAGVLAVLAGLARRLDRLGFLASGAVLVLAPATPLPQLFSFAGWLAVGLLMLSAARGHPVGAGGEQEKHEVGDVRGSA